MTPITTLAPHQVYLFGSNAAGFHGAGAAGYAMRGTAANTWRTDKAFLRAMQAPVGHPDRIGRWAVFGIGRGHQVGYEGMSYAIETIRRPGRAYHRSVPLAEIEDQLIELFGWAEHHTDHEVLMTPIGAGLSGWSAEDMAATLARAVKRYGGLPRNVIAPPDLYDGVDWRET